MTARFSLLLIVKALVMLLLILFAGIQLGPDEAQYWTWSRHLDFGYYSKPPGIAWQIYLGTLLFGQTELGVRFGAVLLGTLLTWAIYRLAKEAGLSQKGCFAAGAMAALTPFGVLASFLAITDCGMLLFWTLGLIEIVKGVQGKPYSSLILGLWIALGALFKWPIYLLWIVAVWMLRSKQLIPGMFLSLVGLLPSVYWNASHDWATFKHVFTIAKGGPEAPAAGNPLEFFGAQVLIFSPLLFVLLTASVYRMNRVQTDAQKFLGRLSLGLFALFFTYSFFKKVQGNWAIYLYPSAFVYLAAYLDAVSNRWRLAAYATALSVGLLAILFILPQFQTVLPWRLNPLQQNLGWDALENWLAKRQNSAFLFSDKYQWTAELSFYNPQKEGAYFFNLQGIRKNQYSYQFPPKIGEDGLFIFVEKAPRLSEKLIAVDQFYQRELKKYFESVSQVEEIPMIVVKGETVKAAFCYRCVKYNGLRPDETDKY